MNTIEKAKSMKQDELTAIIGLTGLIDYGVYPDRIADKIAAGRPEKVIAALNNSDTDHVLLSYVRAYPEKVLSGLAILGYLSGTSKLVSVLPDGENETGELLLRVSSELNLGLTVEYGIVDVRRNRQNQKYHFITALNVAKILDGTYREGVPIALRYIDQEETKDYDAGIVPYGTSLSTLISEAERGHLSGEDYKRGSLNADTDGISHESLAGGHAAIGNPAGSESSRAWPAGSESLEKVSVKTFQIGERLYPASECNMELTRDLLYGSGVVRLYSNNTCMVASMESWIMAKRKNSCGKCTFCREGLNQIWTRIHEMTSGHGDVSSPHIMKEIGEAMPFSTKCSMGQTGALSFLDSQRLFGNEYIDHIKRHRCRTGQCLAYVNIYIDPQRCNGCGRCLSACSLSCIEGMPGYIYMIEPTVCSRCGKCIDECPENAVVRTLEHVMEVPDRLTRVGRYNRYYG